MALHENGWKTIGGPPQGADGAHVRYARDESGRWVITDVYVHGPGLTGETLRGLSLARIEAMQNGPKAVDPGSADDGDLTLGELRRRGAEVTEHEKRRRKKLDGVVTRGGLSRPDGRDPDEFYSEVATAYRQYAEASKSPAAAMAQEAEVPVKTVHRWISEARRRGHLPPGRRGRVG